jgi:hypothetical protein
MRILLIKGVVLVAVIVATLAALARIPAQRSTYLEASTIKHRRLESLRPPRMILVGGSNLAFGVDSGLIQRVVQKPVVNMGLHGAIGIPALLAEVEPYIQKGDIVVVSIEYELFFRDEGLTPELCTMAGLQRDVRRSLGPLRAAQCATWDAVKAIQNALEFHIRRAAGPILPPSAVYSIEGFDSYGDNVAHLKIRREVAKVRTTPSSINMETPDEKLVGELEGFASRMIARGATVVIVPPAYSRDSYLPREKSIDALERELHRRMPQGVVFLLKPAEFAYPETDFFDTDYHLTGPARIDRSQRLAQALLSVKAVSSR